MVREEQENTRYANVSVKSSSRPDRRPRYRLNNITYIFFYLKSEYPLTHLTKVM